jgi:quinol monooxygenase YgiN
VKADGLGRIVLKQKAHRELPDLGKVVRPPAKFVLPKPHLLPSGNISFEWSRSVDDLNVYVLVEAFRDGDAGAAHVNSEHFKDAVARMPDLLAARPQIIYADIAAKDWAPMAEFEVREP